jgi:hypothetical protein
MFQFAVCVNRLARLIGALALCVAAGVAVSFPALASSTAEGEAIEGFTLGRQPLSMSGDGKWVVYVNEQGSFVRKSTSEQGGEQSIKLGWEPTAISVSKTARVVAFSAGPDCIGTVTFPAAGLDKEAPVVKMLLAGQCGRNEIHAPYLGTPIALSGDGKFLAAGYQMANDAQAIRIVDIVTGKVKLDLPAVPPYSGGANRNPILALRFVDDDHKLLSVHALMGSSDEAPPVGPSDMQFAVWDIQKRELFSFHHTGTRGELIEYDFLWDFSEQSGDLWSVNTDGQYWSGSKENHILAKTVDLKHCGSKNPERMTDILSGKHSEPKNVRELAADPLGRWVAIVEETAGNKPGAEGSRILVRDSRTGRQLGAFGADVVVRSLTPTPDGTLLFGVSAGKPGVNGLISPGGRLFRFSLPKMIPASAETVSSKWDDGYCSIEDEIGDARNITEEAPKPRKMYELLLSGEDKWAQSCYSYDGRNIAERWGISNDGHVFLDRYNVIDEIDAGTGKSVQSFKTPRSPTVCSFPWFEQRQFINLQGDTITSRPFSNAAASDVRVVFDRRPGWQAMMARFWQKDLIVYWASKRVSPDGGFTPTLAVVYDPLTHRVLQEKEVPQGGEYDVDPIDYVSLRPPVSEGAFRWELSYFGSVRVRQFDAGQSKTVFWDGLRANRGIPRALDGSRDDTVTDLGNGKGSLIRFDGVSLFEVNPRMRIAEVPVAFARRVNWLEPERLLFVESDGKLSAFEVK